MATKTIAIGEESYTIGALNWGNYEENFFNVDGTPRNRPDFGGTVEAALKNGGDTHTFSEIKAGDVIKLFHETLQLSGLIGSPTGEAPAAE